jgi:hypothetical protein
MWQEERTKDQLPKKKPLSPTQNPPNKHHERASVLAKCKSKAYCKCFLTILSPTLIAFFQIEVSIDASPTEICALVASVLSLADPHRIKISMFLCTFTTAALAIQLTAITQFVGASS